jgi:uncharacterized protein YybS (DUF2232 family)
MSREIATGLLITCLIVAVCAYVPIIGLLGSVFVPVPVMYFRVKLGRQAGAIVAASVLGFVGMLGGAFEVLFFGELLLVGFLLGELAHSGFSIEKTVATVCTAVFVAGLLGLGLLGMLSGTGIHQLVTAGVRHNLELSLELYREIGVSDQQLHLLASSLDTIQKVLVGMVPALAIGFTLVVAWIGLLTARQVFLRTGLLFPDYGALDHWKAPEHLVWGVIACGGLLLVPSLATKTIGLSGLILLMIVYFFQGIAIMAFYLHKKQVPRLARAMLYGLVGVQQLIMLAVVVIGFFDTWFNFRKIEKPLATGGPEL